MKHRYSCAYAPMFRNPCLFNQHTARSSPANYASPPSQTYNYYNYPLPYAPQSQYVASRLSCLPQSYSPYLALPKYSSLPQFPISSYTTPTFSYVPTVSSNGLSLVLIATLILVALDLVIVRPQKSRVQIRGSTNAQDLINI